jgi:hypothetical protein
MAIDISHKIWGKKKGKKPSVHRVTIVMKL